MFKVFTYVLSASAGLTALVSTWASSWSPFFTMTDQYISSKLATSMVHLKEVIVTREEMTQMISAIVSEKLKEHYGFFSTMQDFGMFLFSGVGSFISWIESYPLVVGVGSLCFLSFSVLSMMSKTFASYMSGLKVKLFSFSVFRWFSRKSEAQIALENSHEALGQVVQLSVEHQTTTFTATSETLEKIEGLCVEQIKSVGTALTEMTKLMERITEEATELSVKLGQTSTASASTISSMNECVFEIGQSQAELKVMTAQTQCTVFELADALNIKLKEQTSAAYDPDFVLDPRFVEAFGPPPSLPIPTYEGVEDDSDFWSARHSFPDLDPTQLNTGNGVPMLEDSSGPNVPSVLESFDMSSCMSLFEHEVFLYLSVCFMSFILWNSLFFKTNKKNNHYEKNSSKDLI